MNELTLICTILVQLAGGDVSEAKIKYETLSCGQANIIDLSLPDEEDSMPEEPEPVSVDDFDMGFLPPQWWDCSTPECMDPMNYYVQQKRWLW